MGTFRIEMGIGNPMGGELYPVSALVDTGATHSMAPASLLEWLSITPIRQSRYSIANGEVAEYGVSNARISINGQEWFCPVIFGPEDTYLLGATTLEIFELAVDAKGGRLVPAENLTL